MLTRESQMQIGSFSHTHEGSEEYRPRYDFLTFYKRILGTSFRERKFPFYITLCPFHKDEKTPNFQINIISGSFHCWACFEGDNPVITDKGMKLIKDLKLNDKILSDHNKYQKISKIFKRKYKGIVYDIYVAGMEIKGATPEHKFYVLSTKNCSHRRSYGDKVCFGCYNNKQKQYCKTNYSTDYTIVEKKAKDLNKNDFIVLLNPPNEELPKIKMGEYLPKKERSFGPLHKVLKEEIEITSGFIKLIAMYVTEGSYTCRTIEFSLGINENNLADMIIKNIKKIFGLKCRKEIDNKQNRVRVRCCSVILGKLFSDLCGKGAANKKIPEFMLRMDTKKSRLLLEYLILGDGYVYKNAHCYGTISKKLAQQVYLLAINQCQYNNANIYVSKAYKKRSKDKFVNHKKSYRVTIYKKQGIRTHTRFFNHYKIIRFRRKIKRYVNKDVYNLAIAKTHKYNILGFMVKNCSKRGNAWDFVVHKKPDGKYLFNLPGDVKDADELQKIIRYESSGENNKKEISELTLAIEERRAQQAHEFLFRQPLALHLLQRDRGFTLDTIKKWKLGFLKGAITIPIYDILGTISSLKFHKRFQTEGAVNQLFPWSSVKNRERYIILNEGELDTIILNQYGFNAVTQTCGAHGWNNNFTYYFRKKTTYIAYDNDEQGQIGAEKIARHFWDNKINVFLVRWPEYMHDQEDHIDFFVKYKRTANDYEKLLQESVSVLRI